MAILRIYRVPSKSCLRPSKMKKSKPRTEIVPKKQSYFRSRGCGKSQKKAATSVSRAACTVPALHNSKLWWRLTVHRFVAWTDLEASLLSLAGRPMQALKSCLATPIRSCRSLLRAALRASWKLNSSAYTSNQMAFHAIRHSWRAQVWSYITSDTSTCDPSSAKSAPCHSRSQERWPGTQEPSIRIRTMTLLSSLNLRVRTKNEFSDHERGAEERFTEEVKKKGSRLEEL